MIFKWSHTSHGSIQPTALDELGSCTEQAEQLPAVQIASIQLRCLDDVIPLDHDLYTLLCSENQIYTVLGGAACFDACQLRNALACLQMQCWHTNGHRQSARTTQVLNVRNWPWLYIPNKPSASSLLANGLVTWLWHGIGFHLNENQTLWSSVPLRVISGQKSRSCFGFRPTDKA